jgi:hypothetical protein
MKSKKEWYQISFNHFTYKLGFTQTSTQYSSLIHAKSCLCKNTININKVRNVHNVLENQYKHLPINTLYMLENQYNISQSIYTVQYIITKLKTLECTVTYSKTSV